MSRIKSSFSQVWSKHLEAKAREAGAIDGDIPRLQNSAKNLMVSAGWTSPDGQCDFVSPQDLSACVQAAAEEIASTAQKLAGERRLRRLPVGSTTTKSQVTSGSAHQIGAAAELSSAQTTSSSAMPIMAKPGDRCPRCSGSMRSLGLVNDRAGLYCQRDRVVLPLSADFQMRY
jgi:hypothetical protein